MSACEKCWSDAYLIARRTGQSQVDAYHQLLGEITAGTRPLCTLDEQAGDQ